MPIKGLTNRGLAFPEIGRIRKGAPKDPNKNMPGKDLDHFRVEFDAQEEERARVFFEAYPEPVRDINIRLPFNELDKVWDAWYEGYTAGRLVARSDGEKYVYKINPQNGEVEVLNGEPYVAHPKDGICGYYITQNGKREPIKLKPTGRLKVVVPELRSLAYMTVLTTSIHDIINISQQLGALMAVNGGIISGIPLILRRRPKKISTPDPNDGGKRARRTKWLISIEANPAWVSAKIAEQEKLALPGNGYHLLESPEAPIETSELPSDIEDDEDYGQPEDEWSEGEFEDEEDYETSHSGTPESDQKVVQPRGKGDVRPLSPEALREAINKKAEKCSDKISQGARGMMVGQLDDLFDGDENKRHQLTRYLFGTGSTKGMPGNFCNALLDWMKDFEMARREANAVIVMLDATNQPPLVG